MRLVLRSLPQMVVMAAIVPARYALVRERVGLARVGRPSLRRLFRRAGVLRESVVLGCASLCIVAQRAPSVSTPTREKVLRCFGSHPTIPLHERSVHHHLSVIARLKNLDLESQ